MGCTMVPFSIVLNIIIFGQAYFSTWGQFILATLITTATAFVNYVLFIGIAVIIKRRLPSDEHVKKRLALTIFIYLIISGLFLYCLFTLYAVIRFLWLQF